MDVNITSKSRSKRSKMDIKTQIENKVLECFQKVNSHSPLNPLRMPTISFTLKGRKAGTANWKKWEVNFNLEIAELNGDDFLNRTIPHEIAHLADYQFYGGWGHKRTWKMIMRQIFNLEPTRCHQFDMPEGSLRKYTRKIFVYTCVCPGSRRLHPVSTRKHNLIQKGSKWKCRRCQNILQFKEHG